MKLPNQNSKLSKIVDLYLHSDKFLRLQGRTQKEYERYLNKVLNTKTHSAGLLKNRRVCDITAGMLNLAYAHWLKTLGLRPANYCKQVLSVAWRYAMSLDIMTHNPVALISTITPPPRRIKWEREEIKSFLATAYSNHKWRSIGLIVQMAYDWGQRVGDMRLLTWDSINLDTCRMDLAQSKRGAEVHLPISKGLCAILADQHKDFGYQKYVAPFVSIDGGILRPYQKEEIAPLINKILDEAHLRRELTAMDLRRTAVTEMLEGGVDGASMTQVTGHKNIASLKPYMVNTFSGASKALAARGNNDDDEHS